MVNLDFHRYVSDAYIKSGAFLTDVDPFAADLSCANLGDAGLSGINLIHANLANAILPGEFDAEIEG